MQTLVTFPKLETLKTSEGEQHTAYLAVIMSATNGRPFPCIQDAFAKGKHTEQQPCKAAFQTKVGTALQIEHADLLYWGGSARAGDLIQPRRSLKSPQRSLGCFWMILSRRGLH